MSFQFVKQRLVRTALMALIGILIGAGIAGVSVLKHKQSSALIMNYAGIGGAWSLTDQNGKSVSSKNFNKVHKLIYFGFASCPAICPTELQKMAQAYKDLPKEDQKKLQLIFITVDPERDSPKILKNYVTLFDKSMIGLGGTLEQIETVKSSYKVYAEKVPDGDSYTMDHSSFIYLMSPDDVLLTLFKPDQTAADISVFLKNYFDGKVSKP